MNYPEKISKYISFLEAVKSQTAVRLNIPNLPNEDELQNMKFLGKVIFDEVREFVGSPVYVSSFFRSHQLNKAIGGSPTSQHRHGKAIDIDADVYGGKTNKDIFDYIRAELDFDQLIWEFGTTSNPAWVHVSHGVENKNRRQVLRVYKDESNRSLYVPFDLY